MERPAITSVRTLLPAAEILKKSERQITNYVYRGKKSLKEILNREGFTYEFD